ncbi:hypothetical protein GJ25_gp008 [Mycobacterium phage Hawkeye]|uniref:Uncharacterized protein n=1 Tax=Mycobacterium phage Hawkeye TaxID=1458711 RepID=X2KYS3_9CAUD|nr:hypothetical protein GJ25_gp008 [Mycobacterium phage Hawkeye]AHN84019.1 hypothetical protein PBI_HAWKEYE_8 [Mycobacterium phage Hawkeye]
MSGPSSETAGSDWREKHAAKYGSVTRRAAVEPLSSGDVVQITSNGKTLKGRVSERYRPGVDRMVSVMLEGGTSVQSFGAASVKKIEGIRVKR